MHTATLMYVVLCVYALCTSTRAQKSSSGDRAGAKGIEQIILSKIETLEKKIDANARVVKRQLRREIRRLKSGTSTMDDDPSLLDELKAARMDIKRILDRMETQTIELRAMLNSSMVALNNQREGSDPVMTSELQGVKTNLDEISEKVDAILGAMTSMSPTPTAFTDMVTQISGGVHSPCLRELSMSRDYFTCMESMTSSMSDAAGSGDPLAIMDVMKKLLCNPDACLPRYFKSCPEMKEVFVNRMPAEMNVDTICNLPSLPRQ